MSSSTSRHKDHRWLIENGPKELESLFRAIVFQPSAPILLVDNDRHYREVSSAAAELLRTPREEIIGRRLEDFADPALKPVIPELWNEPRPEGHKEGTLRLLDSDATPREMGYTAKGNVLPVRHLLVLHDKVSKTKVSKKRTARAVAASETVPAAGIPAWVQDFAFYLLDTEGQIVAWYEGAERIYGYEKGDVMGEDVSRFDTEENAFHRLRKNLNRAIAEGHIGTEALQVKKDGTQFWANIVTVALKDDGGILQGFGRAVRDFTERHERDEKLRRDRTRLPAMPSHAAVAGIVSGELDRIPEVNDAFLDIVGYSREDLDAGLLKWSALTPPEYLALDEVAHEEGLQFGSCTPFEKELIRKDGTRVPVLVATAVLKLSPFRWITFVTDLRERNRIESMPHEVVEPKLNFEEFVGNSLIMKRVMAQVQVVAPTDATVLVLGETGTGKELIARAIHRVSPRRNLPFISLNCAAIPTGLLESELFGYERGAFTGALAQKIGRFEMAHRGTLFLDEVGDIPLDLQPKLLRALQEKSFERLGGTRTIPIDVRLIAATNRNLAQMMGDKLFRSDLYYRLKVFPITTPPLRDHAEDIPLLIWHFTEKYAAKMGRVIEKIPVDVMKSLVTWSWPGNVRELENFIERSVILSPGPALRAPVAELFAEAAKTSVVATLEEVERDYILNVFRGADGVVSTTAARLGIPRTTLNAMMAKLRISRGDL